MIDQITETLYGISTERPLIVFREDLQWADAVTLRLLRHLLEDIGHYSLLVVAALRTTNSEEELGHRNLSRVMSYESCERIGLRRLRANDVDEAHSAGARVAPR